MIDAADLPAGALVVDGDVDPDEQNPAVVVNTPPIPASEWDVDDETTVAEYPGNEPYPDSAPVVLAVYRDELAGWRPGFNGEEQIPAADLARGPCYGYAFPAPRVEQIGHLDGAADDEEADEATDDHETDDTDPALAAIADALKDRRVSDVRVADGAVVCEKLGVTYHISPDGSVRETDRVAGKLEDIAADVLGDREVPA